MLWCIHSHANRRKPESNSCFRAVSHEAHSAQMFRCHLSVQIISVSSNTQFHAQVERDISPHYSHVHGICVVSHQHLTSISPVHHLYVTSVSPAPHQYICHQHITSTSPAHHQYNTSMSPVYLQDTTTMNMSLSPCHGSRKPLPFGDLCFTSMNMSLSPCHGSRKPMPFGYLCFKILFCCNEIILGSVRSCSDHVSGRISNYIANALVESTSAHA